MAAREVPVVLAIPDARVAFFYSCIARLPGLMIPLALVVMLVDTRESFSLAGAVAGMFAAGTAAGSPILGRMMRRWGQSKVISISSGLCVILIAAMIMGEYRDQDLGLLLATAAAAGSTLPPFTAAMRSVWIRHAPTPRLRDRAVALDAVTAELLFAVGPAVVSLCLVLGDVMSPMMVALVFLALGSQGYAWNRSVRLMPPMAPQRDSLGQRRPRLLRRRGVFAVLAVAACTSATMGAVDTALVEISDVILGAPSLIGLLIGAIVLGSLIGGLTYGARIWRAPLGVRAAWAQLCLAILLIPVWLCLYMPWGTVPLVMVALIAFGVFLAPCLILQQAVVDERVPAQEMLVAQSTLVGVNTAAIAVGTAVGGVLIDLLGGTQVVGLVVLALALAAGIAAITSRTPAHDTRVQQLS